MSDSEELTFAEFKEFVVEFGHLKPEGTPFRRFFHFVMSGCTEAEAKRWLALHIWDFELEDQEWLTVALAADALHTAAKRAEESEAAKPPARRRRNG